MSNTPKRPLSEVLPVAQKLVDSLAPYCERIELGGSCRRQVAEVGDIEIVAIPKVTKEVGALTLFGTEYNTVNQLHSHLDYLLGMEKIYQPSDSPAWGPNFRKFNFFSKKRGYFKIDLFMCTSENWGVIHLIRTGSADFSKWCVTPQSKGGALPDCYRVAGGQLWKQGDTEGEFSIPVECREEEEYFNFCGVRYFAPHERVAGYWVTP